LQYACKTARQEMQGNHHGSEPRPLPCLFETLPIIRDICHVTHTRHPAAVLTLLFSHSASSSRNCSALRSTSVWKSWSPSRVRLRYEIRTPHCLLQGSFTNQRAHGERSLLLPYVQYGGRTGKGADTCGTVGHRTRRELCFFLANWRRDYRGRRRTKSSASDERWALAMHTDHDVVRVCTG
jgi:hypothetical protein